LKSYQKAVCFVSFKFPKVVTVLGKVSILEIQIFKLLMSQVIRFYSVVGHNFIS